MATTDLATTAEALVAPGKGILAADESTSTIARRFESIGSSRPRQTGAHTVSSSSPPLAARLGSPA
jgi:fructose-bisphosphate aldolase class 1